MEWDDIFELDLVENIKIEIHYLHNNLKDVYLMHNTFYISNNPER